MRGARRGGRHALGRCGVRTELQARHGQQPPQPDDKADYKAAVGRERSGDALPRRGDARRGARFRRLLALLVHLQPAADRGRRPIQLLARGRRELERRRRGGRLRRVRVVVDGVCGAAGRDARRDSWQALDGTIQSSLLDSVRCRLQEGLDELLRPCAVQRARGRKEGLERIRPLLERLLAVSPEPEADQVLLGQLGRVGAIGEGEELPVQRLEVLEAAEDCSVATARHGVVDGANSFTLDEAHVDPRHLLAGLRGDPRLLRAGRLLRRRRRRTTNGGRWHLRETWRSGGSLFARRSLIVHQRSGTWTGGACARAVEPRPTARPRDTDRDSCG